MKASPDSKSRQALAEPADCPVPEGAGWGELARDGRFREALPLIEQDLSAEPEPDGPPRAHVLTKLWWVRGQLATEGMPVAALTTPLSEVLPELGKLSGLEIFSCSTYFLLAEQLAKKKQSRLATLFFDHALGFAGPLGAADRRALRSFAAAAYQEELERATQKREPDSYLEKLRNRIKELEREEPAPTAPPKPAAPKPAPFLSAKTIRETDFTHKEIRDPELPLPEPPPLLPNRPSQLPGFLVGALFVLILFAAWKLGFERRSDPELLAARDLEEIGAKTQPAAVENVAPPAPAAAVSVAPSALPSAAAVLTDEMSDKLKKIDRNLDTLGARLKNVTFNSAEKAKTVDELANDPEVDRAAISGKAAEKLPKPTPSPDGDELASLDGKSTAVSPPVDPKKIPLLDPSRIGEAREVETPHNPNSVSPVDRPRPGDDRDNIHPKLPEFGGPPDPKGRTLDGSPLQGYPVDRLVEPVIYKTITETNVLSAPSFLAQTTDKLPVDTSVQVVSHVGQWLELRSVGGKRGFIYSQNAVPRSEPEKETHPLDHYD